MPFSSTLSRSSVSKDFSPKNKILSEKVFPESVLAGWGYETTELAEGFHAIRSKRNYGDSEVAFYARFDLAKAQFSGEDEAEREKERIETLLETEAGFKNYTQLLRQGNLVYSFSPSGNRVFLGHQPKLLEDAVIYLNTQNAEPQR